MFLRRNRQSYHYRTTLGDERWLRRNGPCVRRPYIIRRYPIGSDKHKPRSDWLIYFRPHSFQQILSGFLGNTGNVCSLARWERQEYSMTVFLFYLISFIHKSLFIFLLWQVFLEHDTATVCVSRKCDTMRVKRVKMRFGKNKIKLKEERNNVRTLF